jgi:hypothetical protein
LVVPTGFLLEAIIDEEFEKKFVYKKYANKSSFSFFIRIPLMLTNLVCIIEFLKASIFARNWAKANNSVA